MHGTSQRSRAKKEGALRGVQVGDILFDEKVLRALLASFADKQVIIGTLAV